jgi:hypothetical protein
MVETSLLGHLSLRLSVHPENIAREALIPLLVPSLRDEHHSECACLALMLKPARLTRQ